MGLAADRPGAVASSGRANVRHRKGEEPRVRSPELLSTASPALPGRWPCASRRNSPRRASQAPSTTTHAAAAPSPGPPASPGPPDPPPDRGRDPAGQALDRGHRGDPRPHAQAPPPDPPRPWSRHRQARDQRADPPDRRQDPRRPARQPPATARSARDRGVGSGGARGRADPRKSVGDRPPRRRALHQQDPPPRRAPGRRRPRRGRPDHPRHLRAGRRTARARPGAIVASAGESAPHRGFCRGQ